MVRRIDWRALEGRARKPRLRLAILEKSGKLIILRFTYVDAQPRARPSSARQSIFLITEMIFDYLVAIVAPKAEKIALLKI